MYTIFTRNEISLLRSVFEFFDFSFFFNLIMIFVFTMKAALLFCEIMVTTEPSMSFDETY